MHVAHFFRGLSKKTMSERPKFVSAEINFGLRRRHHVYDGGRNLLILAEINGAQMGPYISEHKNSKKS